MAAECSNHSGLPFLFLAYEKQMDHVEAGVLPQLQPLVSRPPTLMPDSRGNGFYTED